MWMFVLVSIFMLIMLISILFDLVSKKESWDKESSSVFECGFTSYYFSRFSFSIHYYVIGLIFLFLDLELCFMMPLFLEFPVEMVSWLIFFFSSALLLGLLEEWRENKLEWVY